MPLPKFSSRYPDVREVFDYALANGGARYTLDTPGKAINWRARAYAFRKALWGEINASGTSLPMPYDGVKITIEDCTCVIHIETATTRGILTPLSGGEIKPVPATDELESEAEDFAKRLGIKL